MTRMTPDESLGETVSPSATPADDSDATDEPEVPGADHSATTTDSGPIQVLYEYDGTIRERGVPCPVTLTIVRYNESGEMGSVEATLEESNGGRWSRSFRGRVVQSAGALRVIDLFAAPATTLDRQAPLVFRHHAGSARLVVEQKRIAGKARFGMPSDWEFAK